MAELAIQYLLKEHREIEKALNDLESLLDSRAEWSAVHSETLALILLLFGRELAGHIQKEEELLFPALEGLLPHDEGPLTVLRDEHRDLCRYFCRLCHAGHSMSEEHHPESVREEFQRSARATIRIMRDHIYKEDRVLFPLVARLLPPGVDEKLLERMESLQRSRADLPAGSPCQ